MPDAAFADRLMTVARALAEADSAHLTDAELLGAIERAGDLRRLADAAGATLTAELDARSGVGNEASLARRMGARSSAALVVERARVDASTAAAWLAVGEAVSPRVSILGEVLPNKHEAVASALREGAVDAVTARSIISTVEHCSADALEATEVGAAIVDVARAIPPRDAARLCREVLARWLPENADERERVLRARRSLRIVQTAEGMTRITIDADPESAGYLVTALDARTSLQRRPRFVDVDAPGEPDDSRPLDQRRLDALVDIAREALAHDDGQVAGAAVTMLVTVPLETLQSRVGTASIAGIDEPIGPRTARRLAAAADIIPVVLAGESEPLDLGVTQRLFSPAQRRAMAIRDGGCAWPGCDAPPGRTQAAHIRPWWAGGATDLDNGVLLCWSHHYLFDHDGWTLEWRDGVPWFVPPPWVDSSRTPRRGGRVSATTLGRARPHDEPIIAGLAS